MNNFFTTSHEERESVKLKKHYNTIRIFSIRNLLIKISGEIFIKNNT